MQTSTPEGSSRLSWLRPALLYLLLVTGVCVFILAASPIVYLDADVWIHLSGGKYLMEHHHVPRDSYFSFLTPPRPWNNYAWLFQALIYTLYRWWGAVGLILLRAVVYATAMLVIIRLLFAGQDRARCARWLTLVAVLFAVVLLPRAMNVRPHLFTYLFIPAFLYLLERRPDRAGWLPLLGLLWCNLHGVTYPVMLLIAGAYSLEYVVQRLRGIPREAGAERRFFVPVVCTMMAVFLTPLGLKLLDAPFRPMAYLETIITEMMPITWDELTTLNVAHGVPTFKTLFNVALAAVLLSALMAVSKRRLRVSHAVLLLGGLALLLKGQRFKYECLLLSLPMLRANPLPLFDRPGDGTPRPVGWAISLIAMSLPLMFLTHFLRLHRQYPVSTTGLPEGVSAFLKRVPARGSVLNSPNSGGYLRWQLYPQYRLFMDMDSYFSDEDFYRGTHMFTDPTILRKTLLEHDPSFISVTLGDYANSFRELIKQFPIYEVIFFDDAEVLYVNRRHYPELAQQYRLETLDPYDVIAQEADVALADSSRHERLLKELHRLLETYPDGGGTNHFAGMIFNRQGAYDRALEHAERIINRFPESPSGYVLKAEALKGLGKPREALAAYRLAIPRANGERRGEFVKQMGLIYFEQGEHAHAYRLFTQSISIFAPQTSLEELYAFGLAALQARKTSVAYAIFSYMDQFRVPEGDTMWKPKLAAALSRFEAIHP